MRKEISALGMERTLIYNPAASKMRNHRYRSGIMMSGIHHNDQRSITAPPPPPPAPRHMSTAQAATDTAII